MPCEPRYLGALTGAPRSRRWPPPSFARLIAAWPDSVHTLRRHRVQTLARRCLTRRSHTHHSLLRCRPGLGEALRPGPRLSRVFLPDPAAADVPRTSDPAIVAPAEQPTQAGAGLGCCNWPAPWGPSCLALHLVANRPSREPAPCLAGRGGLLLLIDASSAGRRTASACVGQREARLQDPACSPGAQPGMAPSGGTGL